MQSFPVTLAHNPAYAEGQQGSVRVGLAALSGSFDAVFVVLADQPMIGAGDLTELIGAFKKRPAGHVVVPVVAGERGNPIVLDEVAHAQILASDTNLACRHLIERQPELVHVHETANTRFVVDLDTVRGRAGAGRAHRLAAGAAGAGAGRVSALFADAPGAS